MCTCRAVQPALRPRGGGAGPLPARPRPPAAPGRTSSSTTRCGRSCGSRSTWRSSSTTPRRERVVAFYPSPMGATESLLELRAWTRARGSATRCSRELEPDVEALLVNRARGARDHWLVPIDECYALVGPDPDALAGPHRRPGGLGRDRRASSRGSTAGPSRPAERQPRKDSRDDEQPEDRQSRTSRRTRPRTRPGIKQGNSRGNYERHERAQARRHVDRRALDRHQRAGSASRSTRACRTCRPRRGDTMSATTPRPAAAALDPAIDVDFAVEGAGTLAHAAVPTLRFGLRIRADGERPIRSILLDVQLQIAARAALLRRRREGAPAGAVRRARPLGHDAADAAVDRASARTSRGSPARPWSTCTCPCTYDFEVTAAKYLQALDGGEVPLEFLFSGTVFYMSEARAAADGADQLGARGRVRAAGQRVARDDGPLLPGQRLAAAVARDLRPPLRLPRPQHDADLGARARRAARPHESTEAAERWTRSRKIADAVLYEGYVLWPYSRSATKNQRRWTFGGVYPRGALASGIRTTRA